MSTIYQQISAARATGVVRCAGSSADNLDGVAKDLGLSTVPGTYRVIDAATARQLLVDLLHLDLAYSAEIMPRSQAEQLADAFLAAAPPGAVFYSNGEESTGPWTPATRASYDRGVLVVGAGGSSGFWIEDED